MTIKAYGNPEKRSRVAIPAYILIIGLMSGIRFRFVGDIYFGEIFALVIVIDNFFNKGRRVNTRSNIDKYFYIWIMFLITSSLLNQSDLKKFLVALVSAIFTISIFKAYLIISRRGVESIQILTIVFLGQAFGGILQPKEYGLINGWKYQYGYAMGVFLVLLLYKRSKLQVIQFLLVGLALFSISNSARSLASFFLIAFLLSFPMPISESNTVKRLSWLSRLMIVGIALAAVYFSYLVSAKAGYLGTKEIARAERLTSTTYGPLVGRSEIFYSVYAILGNPLFGYGSSPELSSDFFLNISTKLSQQGFRNENGGYLSPDKIPMHSILLGTAVSAGLPAAMFWMMGLLYSVKFVKYFRYLGRVDRIPIVLISVSEFWNILFSPYGAALRLTVSCSFAFLYLLYTERIKFLQR